MAHALSNTVYASPLRVDQMDARSRQRLRDYLRAQFVSYHEDEHRQPAFMPGQRADSGVAPAAASAATQVVRRPVRGLVKLRSCPDATCQRGIDALLEISTQGELTLWGGTDFDDELLRVELRKLIVHFSQSSERSDMFVLSVAQSTAVPAVFCFVKNRSKWLTNFCCRGVTPLAGGVADV